MSRLISHVSSLFFAAFALLLLLGLAAALPRGFADEPLTTTCYTCGTPVCPPDGCAQYGANCYEFDVSFTLTCCCA